MSKPGSQPLERGFRDYDNFGRCAWTSVGVAEALFLAWVNPGHLLYTALYLGVWQGLQLLLLAVLTGRVVIQRKPPAPSAASPVPEEGQ